MSAQVFKQVEAFFKDKFRTNLPVSREKITNSSNLQQGECLSLGS